MVKMTKPVNQINNVNFEIDSYCENCGSPLPENTAFCYNCGFKILNNNSKKLIQSENVDEKTE